MLWDKLACSKVAAAVVTGTPVYVAMSQLSNFASDATRNLNAPAHNVGDYIVAVTGRRTDTHPTLISGYTNITSANNGGRSLRVQYKVATGTSETVTFVGAYGHIWIIRDASSILQSSTQTGGASVAANLPDLFGLTAGSIIIAGSYPSNVSTAVSSPYTLTNSTGARIANNSNSSLTGKTMNFSASLFGVTYAVEIG